jgi:hypothetical protein
VKTASAHRQLTLDEHRAGRLFGQVTFDEHLAARFAVLAYADGFAHGADPERAERADVVDARAAADWRRGFEAGQRAAAVAATAYRTARLRCDPAGLDGR